MDQGNSIQGLIVSGSERGRISFEDPTIHMSYIYI